MADLIDRQMAIEELNNHRSIFCDHTPESFRALWVGDKCRVNEIDNAIATLVNLPSVQSEQKHGHWDLVEGYYDDEHWQCSCCGEEWYLEAGNPTDNEMYYCPHCGAKMDEEVKQDGLHRTN